jgi:hypothetical protein
MADPLSPAASIIAVLVLAKEVASYFRGVRDAPDDRSKISAELASITAILEIIKDQLEEVRDTGKTQLAAISAIYKPKGPLSQLEAMLDLLRARLSPKSGMRQLSKKLTWPFCKNEALEILMTIERLKSLFILALENDEL